MSTASPLATPLGWDLVAPGYAEVNVEHFEKYAQDAIALAKLGVYDRVVDVATGPGSLAMLAAPSVAHVLALDFSEQMLSAFRSRLKRTPLGNVNLVAGDGQALPFADNSFDAAFSMFGLIFFPERAKGFAELRRVLSPRGRAVVSSWQPMQRVPLLVTVFEILALALPNVPFGDGKGPLSDPDELRSEMAAAGFDVEVHEVIHSTHSPNFDVFWSEFQRSFAPLVLLKHKLGGEAYAAMASDIETRLLAKLGPGPVAMSMPAWLALGHCR